MTGKVFCTSDLHLSHVKVAQLRGFSNIEDHDTKIIDNILQTVGKGDSLWILGDLLFNRSSRIWVLERLMRELVVTKNTNVKVVLGNHDNWTTKWLTDLLIHRAYGAAYGHHGILFTHIPVHGGQKDRFTLNVHGHLHDKVIADPWYFNVCLEQNNLKPFSMEEIYAAIPSSSVVPTRDDVSHDGASLCKSRVKGGGIPPGAEVLHPRWPAFRDL